MITSLKTSHIGPVEQMEIDFASRWNVFVGDNGLGKTFILDLVWYALTKTWVERAARPTIPINPQNTSKPIAPEISAKIQGKTGIHEIKFSYNPKLLDWQRRDGTRPPEPPGIVLYARADGEFAVWDVRRHIPRKREGDDEPQRANIFSNHELWWGLNSKQTASNTEPKRLCRGLIEDWIAWQNADNDVWRKLCALLRTLSPSEQEPLTPAQAVRLDPEDVRDIPTITTPYGDEIPILFASTGIRRILALGYLLLWSWQEHTKAGHVFGAPPEPPTTQIVLLVDELEAHLHPKWQRTIIHALMTAAKSLMGEDVHIQLITATHSPLVMASLEPHFDTQQDKVFHLDLRDGSVTLDEWTWVKQGDVSDWLTSDLFELRQPRSTEAEEAIIAAENFMLGRADENPPQLRDAATIEAALARTLSSMDHFWPSWITATRYPKS